MAQSVRPHRSMMSQVMHPDVHMDSHQALAFATLLIGPISALSALADVHVFTTWTGFVAVLMGFVSQLLSDNRPEHLETVVGWGAGAVGLMVGLAHGGFI